MKKENRMLIATINKKDGTPLYRIFYFTKGKKKPRPQLAAKKIPGRHPDEKYSTASGKRGSVSSIFRIRMGTKKRLPVCTVKETKDSRIKLIFYDGGFSATLAGGIPCIVFTKPQGVKMRL